MNILVTGANGQLGNEMRIVSRNSSDRYIFTDVMDIEGVQTTHLDITDIEAIRAIVKENDVKCIVNCAAYTNVDKAESDEAFCRVLNAKAPENLAVVMAEVDGLLVHVSTDYVFGADPYNVPCKEDQKGTPTGVYGKTKLEGEQAIIASGCKYIILRTAWLYSEFGKNFVKTMLNLTATKPQLKVVFGKNFVKTMLNLTATKPQLKVVFDQVGTPTYALDLANAIYNIVNGRKYEENTGIYHYSNEGVCSWYDFTKMIAMLSGHNECDIQPCHSDEFPSPVIRPSYSVFDKTKVKNTFGVKVPYWLDSLKTCLNNMNELK